MKKIVILLVLSLFALTLVSCEDSFELPNFDVEELPVPEIPADFVQGISGNTVKIGNTVSKSGGFASVGVPFDAGIRAAIQEYEALDTSKWDIDYITYDDQTDSALGLTNTRKLIEEDKVFAIVGHLGTGTVGATLEYILEQHIPMVYAATGINNLFFQETPGNPIMPVQPLYRTDGQIVLARVVNEALFGENKDELLPDGAKIVVMYTNDDAGKSIAAGIIAEAKELGVERSLVLKSFESTTVSTVSRSTVGENPDVIIVAGNQEPFNEALVALADLDNKVPVFTSYVNTNASTITNRDYGFDIYGSGWIDIVDPDGLYGFSAEYWQFVAAVTAAGHAEYAANAFAMAGYIAGWIFLTGIDRLDPANNPTILDFVTAMESEPVSIPMGAQVDFSGGKRWGVDAMLLSQYVRTESEEGVFTPAFVVVKPMETLEEIRAKR